MPVQGTERNAGFVLPLVLEDSQVSCLVRKTGYTAFSSWVQIQTLSGLVGWGNTDSHLPRSCLCDGCILQPVSCREAEWLDWILNSGAVATSFRIRTSKWTLYSFQVSFVFLTYLKIYLLQSSVSLVFPSTSFPFVSFQLFPVIINSDPTGVTFFNLKENAIQLMILVSKPVKRLKNEWKQNLPKFPHLEMKCLTRISSVWIFLFFFFF